MIQNPIPTFIFTPQVMHFSVKKLQGWGFVYIHCFYIIPTLFAYFLACHPYIFNVFILLYNLDLCLLAYATDKQDHVTDLLKSVWSEQKALLLSPFDQFNVRRLHEYFKKTYSHVYTSDKLKFFSKLNFYLSVK